jgi:predicted  nucleic acid-binding Zn-ribbon protein
VKKVIKKVDAYKAKVVAAEEEAAILREKAFEVQAQLEEARKTGASQVPSLVGKSTVDTFDTEGQYQVLYKECLTALNKERDLRHEVVGLSSSCFF